MHTHASRSQSAESTHQPAPQTQSPGWGEPQNQPQSDRTPPVTHDFSHVDLFSHAPQRASIQRKLAIDAPDVQAMKDNPSEEEQQWVKKEISQNQNQNQFLGKHRPESEWKKGNRETNTQNNFHSNKSSNVIGDHRLKTPDVNEEVQPPKSLNTQAQPFDYVNVEGTNQQITDKKINEWIDTGEVEDIFWYFTGAFDQFAYEKELLEFYSNAENWSDFYEQMAKGSNPKVAKRQSELPNLVRGLTPEERDKDYALKPSGEKNKAGNMTFYWGQTQKAYITKDMKSVHPSATANRAIFIMTTDGKIYSADMNAEFDIGANRRNNEQWVFHHSSFLGGKPVASAGEIEFDEEGSLTAISDLSGHYKPSSQHTLQILLKFIAFGVDLSNVAVNDFQLKDELKKKYDNDQSIIDSLSKIPAPMYLQYRGNIDAIIKDAEKIASHIRNGTSLADPLDSADKKLTS